MKQKITTQQLVESGVLLGLGFVLSMLKVKLIAAGGSITAASMLPIVLLAIKYGPGWGTLCGFVHGALQIIEGGGIAPPVKTLSSYVIVVLLDFLLAWAMVGLIAGLLRGVSRKPRVAVAVGAFAGIAGRFLCSFISGIVIWGVYAPEGQSAALYSFIVNGSVMIPEMILTALIGFALLSIPVMQRRISPIEPAKQS